MKLEEEPLASFSEIKSVSEASSSKIFQPQIDESLLEEKIKKMMPDFISKMKSEIMNESRI
jgi:ribosomal protein L13